MEFVSSRLCVRFLFGVPFLLLFALLIRGGVLLTPGALKTDPDSYRRLAENIVDHGTFGQDDASTAYRPPLYPLALVPCVAMGQWENSAIAALHALLGVATVALVLLLGRWWGLSRGGSTLAALLVACDPILLAQSAQVMTETLATFLAVAGLVVLTWSDRRPTMWRTLIVGVVLTLGSLCRPTMLLFMAAIAVVWTWRIVEYKYNEENSRGPTARGGVCNNLCRLFAFVFGILVVLSPWIIRNQIQFGRPIVATTHGGYTLFLANNPSFYEWLRSGEWGSVWSADDVEFSRQCSRFPRNELEANEQAYAEARKTIAAEPGTFFYACLVRIGRFWSPLPHQLSADETPLRRAERWMVALWYVLEFALAAIGVWSVVRAKPQAAGWLWGLLLVVCTMAPHVVYWTDMRMRAPVMPVVALAAAAGAIYCREPQCRGSRLE